MNRLYLDIHTSHQPDRVSDLVRRVQKDDPLAPVTVVGPSNYANLSLRHWFAQTGFANVRFMVMPRLAEYLGGPLLASKGLTPLTGVLESAAVRAVSERATGRLYAVRSHPMTQQSLKFTFRQLRYASGETLDRLAEMGGLPADTVALYRLYRQRTSGFYDDEQLARAAADAVSNETATALLDLGFVVFYHLREVTPAQRELVNALAARGRCRVMLSATGDADADAPIEAIVSGLTTALGEAERPSASPSDGPPAARTGAQILVAPDPHQEIRWAIRRIMSLAERGTPFHRMAVLYRQQDPYGTLIGEEMALAGVPIAGPARTTLADTAVGRALTGLMKIADGDFARDSVTAWLTGSPVRPPRREGRRVTRFNPSRWDKLSKKAGIVGGERQWLDRLNVYADNRERGAEDGLGQGEISEWRARAMRLEAEAARELREFVSGLAARVSPPADGSSWSEFIEWAKELLNDYVAIPSTAQDQDSEVSALEKIEDALDMLVTAQAIDPSPTFVSFRRALDEALSAPVGHLGTTGQGVFVAPVRAAAGMRFDTVHVVGMVEGAMPPAARDDPLIPDRARQAVGGASVGLPLRSERRALDRYDFLSALAAAPDRALSYPVADPASQRAHSPSRWLLEQASILNGGESVYTSDLPKLRGEGWLTIVPSFSAALAAAPNSAYADLADYDLERLWRWEDAGLRTREHPLAGANADQTLARSLALSHARFSEAFTEWDGNVSAAADGSRFARSLSDSVHSPTGLQRWATCPFSYFLGNALHLGATESPEDVHSISPLDRGILVHAILEKFILHVSDDGTIPAPDAPWSAEHRRALFDIAAEQFEDAKSRGVVGKPVMWEIESEAILTDLESFLEQDAKLRRRFEVAPRYAEVSFGMGGSSWTEATWTMDDGAAIRFRGVIDRVDVAPDGRSALALDYKTGSPRPYSGLEDDPTDRGKRLQLGIYALAARQALGEDVDVTSAYWFVTGRGGFEIAPKQPVRADDAAARQRFGEVVSTIASGVRGGVFPANPGTSDRGGFSNCTYCDFDSLCPSRRGVTWERKQNDGLLADYLKLADEE